MKNSIKYCTSAICIIILSIFIFSVIFIQFPEKINVPDQIKAGASLPPFVSSDDPNQTQYPSWNPSAAPGNFAGGSGTENDPYLIANAEQLALVSSYLSTGDYFALVQNIDLSDWIAQNYAIEGWLPLGNEMEPFSGHFDGNYHSISGLWTDRTNALDFYIGLFGVAENASFTNLHIETVSKGVNGEQYVGLLAGKTTDCLIDNISFEGSASAQNELGGLVAVADNGISNARGRIALSGATEIGGLVATVEGSGYVFDNCHVDITLEAEYTAESDIVTYAGGLLGKISEESSVTNSSVFIDAMFALFNINTYSKRYAIGGLVGDGDTGARLEGNRTAGIIKSTETIHNIGGMLGYSNTNSNISIENFAIEIEISLESTASCYYIGGIIGYASAVSVKHGTVSAKIESEKATYSGGFAGDSNRSYFSDIVGEVEISGRSYIGGAFGDNTSDVVENIQLISHVDASTRSAGGFVGTASGSSIFRDIKLSGSVTALDVFVGGFGGQMNNCQIYDSAIDVDVNAKNYVGGLAGSFDGTVKDTSTTGTIIGDSTVGGFFGTTRTFTAENCFSTANIFANSGPAAGFVAQLLGSSILKNCYATGDVTVTQPTGLGGIGGFIGSAYNFITIEDCFSTGNVFNYADSATSSAATGGFIGRINLVQNTDASYNPQEDMFIRRCYAFGEVYSAVADLGGFVGSITLSSAMALSITVTIEECFYSGMLNGPDDDVKAGGFVADIYPYKGKVILSNIYANALINVPNTTNTVGGLVGHLRGSAPIEIMNAYFAGTIEARQTEQVGGISGRIANTDTTISASFYDASLFSGFAVANDPDYAGITGESSQNMQQELVFLAAGWDPSIWNIKEKDVYPHFTWLKTDGNSPLLHLSYIYDQNTYFAPFDNPFPLEVSVEVWGNELSAELVLYLSQNVLFLGQNPLTLTLLDYDETLEVFLPIISRSSGSMTTYIFKITRRHPADAISILPDTGSADNLDCTMWDLSKGSYMYDPITFAAVFTDMQTLPDISGLTFRWILSAQTVANGLSYTFDPSGTLKVYEILLMVTDPFGNQTTASFTLNLVDKSALTDLAEQAKKVTLNPFTAGSAQTLTLAIQSASSTLTDNTVSQSVIDAQSALLRDALDNLVDLRALREEIAKAEQIEEGRYIESSYKNLRQALEEAETVEANANATALEVSLAVLSLQDAYAALKNDRSELEQAVANANLMNPQGFTEGKWIEFNMVLAEASAVLANPAAYQLAIDDAAKNMNAQILRVTVNTAALEALAGQAAFLQQEQYTADSWSTFAAALSQANSVLEKDIYLQTVIDDTANKLSVAMKNLTLAEQEQPSTIFSDQLLSILISAVLVLLLASMFGVFLRYLLQRKK